MLLGTGIDSIAAIQSISVPNDGPSLKKLLLHVHHVHVSGYDATCQQMHAIILNLVLNLVCACGAACGARGACVYTAAPGYATKFSTKYSRHSSQY